MLMVKKAVLDQWFPWNGLRHLGDSGNGGKTLEFLSPFLWRAPPNAGLNWRQEEKGTTEDEMAGWHH